MGPRELYDLHGTTTFTLAIGLTHLTASPRPRRGLPPQSRFLFSLADDPLPPGAAIVCEAHLRWNDVGLDVSALEAASPILFLKRAP